MARQIFLNVSRRTVRLSQKVLLLLTVFSTYPAHAQSPAGSFDHLRILVRDINACDDTYRKIGFGVLDQPSFYLEGSAHNLAYLSGDDSYIELIGVADRQKLYAVRPWIVDFIQEHEGAHSAGFVVPSAKEKSRDLAKVGIAAPVFDLIRSKSGAKPVELVTPKLASLSEGSIFFLEYPPSDGPAKPYPPNLNGATGVLGVWIATKNLVEAKSDAMKLGFQPGRTVQSSRLGATGIEMEATRGKIVLLEAGPSGPANDVIRERGVGIMGLSVAVSDLASARSMLEGATKQKFVEYQGFYGKSLLVPPSLTCGVWIEMVHHP